MATVDETSDCPEPDPPWPPLTKGGTIAVVVPAATVKAGTAGRAPAGVSVNRSAVEAADVPVGVVTVTSTVNGASACPEPAPPSPPLTKGGEMAVIVPLLALSVNEAAGVSPK